MIILGIDPGTTSIGYALLQTDSAYPQFLGAGLIDAGKDLPEDRLRKIHLEIKGIIKKWKPSCLALEKLFFAKNQKTALLVSEARGVIILTGSLAGLTLFEYSPPEVKQIVTGDGRADKAQVKKMLGLTLPAVKSIKARDDVFDAIGIALTCFFKERNNFKRSMA